MLFTYLQYEFLKHMNMFKHSKFTCAYHCTLKPIDYFSFKVKQ